MERNPPKPRRKCGPRVKTGCITCRIRRVKCDEGKPACQRCLSTGRKCDGYKPIQSDVHVNDTPLDLVPLSTTSLGSPLDGFDSQREQTLFHYYCVQSAFDLSVYLDTDFWYSSILRYSQYNPVVRQAVIAFGSSHLYAVSVNQAKEVSETSQNALEQAQLYDKAIRRLRRYIETQNRPDHRTVLICCALLFSCENSRGNREAALQHLENGLHMLSLITRQQPETPALQDKESKEALELVASQNGSRLKAKVGKPDIDEELVYVFSRLDVQATLCKETRKPVLDLAKFSNSLPFEHLYQEKPFVSITEAQRSLDFIHNSLARFLSTQAVSGKKSTTHNLGIASIESERARLDDICSKWEACMRAFIANQKLEIKQNLQVKHAPKPTHSSEGQLAIQIQLLILHHRCWWMLFRSSYDLSAFTMSPNPRAEEILDICDFLGFALPVRPSAISATTEADLAWKMISEIGVTAPLFVLATKCTDEGVRSRSISQLKQLRNHGNGLYHKSFLAQHIPVVLHQTQPERRNSSPTPVAEEDEATLDILEHPLLSSQYIPNPTRSRSLPSIEPLTIVQSNVSDNDSISTTDATELGGLLGWSNPSPKI